MRIKQIKIDHWRHFENLHLRLDSDTGLVCVVGANGTGKTHLLELIASCAHHLGLSQGIEIPRGDPFADEHDFSLQFQLAMGISATVDQGLDGAAGMDEWDRTLTITSRKETGRPNITIEAGGVTSQDESKRLAAKVVGVLRASEQVHFLCLDADRAYPKKNINANEVAAAYDIDWAGVEYTRGRSFRPTTTLYDEWIKYFLARENQSGTLLIKEIRKARVSGNSEPNFEDHFDGFKIALQSVLPHVVFTGVDSKRRTLVFDTTGLELTFNQLSGGEREIAFLVGQIDRFGLRHGLFLLDEPELHLNADLIRSWVHYLTGTVETGQIWLATHSLEAVEAAGQSATFILERNDRTRKVDNVSRLDARPMLSALSRAVGTPAFSISQLAFVFVEGEESLGERERFRRLAGMPKQVRFIECGSCTEVTRRTSAIRSLAKEAGVQIRVGGIVDKDFRSEKQTQSFVTDGILVLPVHEIENFFFHPQTLSSILTQNGRTGSIPSQLVKNAGDKHAGSWIFQYALAMSERNSLPALETLSKDYAKGLTWQAFHPDSASAIQEIVDRSGFDHDSSKRFAQLLKLAAEAYSNKRETEGLWKVCEGKQVLGEVAKASGFSCSQTMIEAAFSAWNRNVVEVPEEVNAIRTYVNSL